MMQNRKRLVSNMPVNRETYKKYPYDKMTRTQLKQFREYQTEYNKSHYRMFIFRLRYDNDAELIEKLQKHPEGVSGYIKRLVKEDMEKQGAK